MFPWLTVQFEIVEAHRSRTPARPTTQTRHLYQIQAIGGDRLEGFITLMQAAVVIRVREMPVEIEDLQNDLHLELRTLNNPLV